MQAEKNVYNDFKRIHEIVSSERFRNMEGLSGEIPFWIAPYHIKDEDRVDVAISNLVKRLSNDGINALCVDLFDLTCSLVDSYIGLEEMIVLEEGMEKSLFKNALQSSINIHERLIPEITVMVEKTNPQMLFLKGIGKVYPFIRSHIVLNNLQSAITHIPTLMFYPGKYSGISLRLFDTLEDDNYYRANNIFSQ